MVVDVRYHLASLVATFLSLGLGILIGTSLSGDGEELLQRDRWLTMLEREFDQLRERAREMEASIDRLTEERDRYAAFSAELVEGLAPGRLEGLPVALVTVGAFEGALEVEGLLRSAGAEVVRRVALSAETLSAPSNRLPSGEAPAAPADAGRALARLVLSGAPEGGEGGSAQGVPGFLRIETLTGAQEGAAEGVVLLLGGPHSGGNDLLLTLLREFDRQAAKAIALLGDEGWRKVLEEASTPYITHFESPMGKFSLLLLLSTGGEGAYGFGAGVPLWPKELFGSVATGESGR